VASSPIAAGKSSFSRIDANLLLNTLKIQPGERVLDAASGLGHYVMKIAETQPGTTVIALDLWFEGLLQTTQPDFSNIRRVNADLMEPLPIKDKTIDICLMATFFHDLKAAGKEILAAREIHRILKNNGRFAVIEFHKIQTQSGPPVHVRLSPAELDNEVTKAGFMPVQTLDLAENMYLSVFEKTE